VFDAGNGGADACVFSNIAGIILRNVEIRADEYPLASEGEVCQSKKLQINTFLATEFTEDTEIEQQRNPAMVALAGFPVISVSSVAMLLTFAYFFATTRTISSTLLE
jgi:hypothetical protein